MQRMNGLARDGRSQSVNLRLAKQHEWPSVVPRAQAPSLLLGFVAKALEVAAMAHATSQGPRLHPLPRSS